MFKSKNTIIYYVYFSMIITLLVGTIGHFFLMNFIDAYTFFNYVILVVGFAILMFYLAIVLIPKGTDIHKKLGDITLHLLSIYFFSIMIRSIMPQEHSIVQFSFATFILLMLGSVKTLLNMKKYESLSMDEVRIAVHAVLIGMILSIAPVYYMDIYFMRQSTYGLLCTTFGIALLTLYNFPSFLTKYCTLIHAIITHIIMAFMIGHLFFHFKIFTSFEMYGILPVAICFAIFYYFQNKYSLFKEKEGDTQTPSI